MPTGLRGQLGKAALKQAVCRSSVDASLPEVRWCARRRGMMRLLLLFLPSFTAFAGVEFSGRLVVPETEPPVMLAAVRAFGFPGGHVAGSAFRTWEMEPRGWWKLEGAAGDWQVLFTGPAHFMRPALLSATLRDGEKNNHLRAVPRFDYTCFHEAAWDTKPAAAYWQPFTARSASVTHVGFKLATDGVDGPGPGSQPVRISIHRVTEGAPETWPQTGPGALVPAVDCGGAKSYHYSAGWHSGEVKLEKGGRYAVRIQPEKPGAAVQAFWAPEVEADGCWRTAPDGKPERSAHRLWMTVSGDGDGLLLPCNKRVHQEFGDFAGYTTSWTQTWRAQGTSLCGVMLYLATSGTQPRMEEQRIAIRIRRGGAGGPVISPEKTGAAAANYTGDASWGVLGAVFPRGEVALTPGELYAAEFTTLETPDSIGSFVNFKKQHNDRKPGFNPYFRHSADDYADGGAWRLGKEQASRDLDTQVVEYAP
jgi:hypothetical protein